MTTKEKMFNDNIGLVHKIINYNFACFKKGEFYGDLFNEGCVALLKSIDKFDKSKGFKFSTFACKNIYFTISLYINTKIYQKKKTCNKVIFEDGTTKVETIFLEADIISYNIEYNNGTEQEEIINFHHDFSRDESGYLDVEQKILLESMFKILKELEDTGKKRFQHIYEITKLKSKGYSSRKISDLLGVSQVTVDRKMLLAIECLKDYMKVA